jgi:hypothetical protein
VPVIEQVFLSPPYPPPTIPYGVDEGMLGVAMLIFRRLKRKQKVYGGRQKKTYEKNKYF